MEENLAWRTERFFAKNWKFIFWGLVIAILVVAYEIYGINSRMTSLEKTIAENNAKVVLTTMDGRAIKVQKTPLKAELLKKYVVSMLVNNLLVDRAALTHNFEKNDFKKYSDILKSSKNLATIYTDFIDHDDKVAMGYFISYLNWILTAIAQDKLPEFISIKDYRVDQYTYNGNKFHVEISIKVKTQNYIVGQDKYVTKNGIVKISADGYFDLEKSSDINPYGVRITKFKIEMPTK